MKTDRQLTDSEKRVIDYINEHCEYVVDMSIQNLAKETYSSNATILRLCKKLGYQGFKDLKLALVKDIESQKYVHQSIDFSSPFYQKEPTLKIINSMANLYKESIDLINAQLDIKNIDQIVDTIIQSHRLYIYAIGDSKITAMNFMNKLIKIDYYPILATENQEEIHMSKNVKKDDCALFLSYGGEYQSFKKCLQILKSNRCQIITMTANERALICQYSDYTITIPDKENDEKIATFYSQLSFHYILNILYSLIYARQYSKYKSHIK